MGTNRIKGIVALIVALMSLTIISGCGSTQNNVKNTANKTVQNDVQKDLINYINVELPKVEDLDSKVRDDYSSVTGDNYKNDKTTYDELTKEIIPNSKKLTEQAEEITPNTEEVRSLHELFISATNNDYSAFLIIESALETQDVSKVSAGNDKLDAGRKDMRDFGAKLKALETKYNVAAK